MNLLNKKIMIIGLGKSGIGAANLCLKHGAKVTVADGKPKEAVEDALSKIHGSIAIVGAPTTGHDQAAETTDLNGGNAEAASEQQTVTAILGRNPGHDEVLEQDMIVPSPAVPLDLEFLTFAKENNIPVWSEIELASRFCKATLIGITGTNGKTTTTTLVGEIASKVWPGSQAAGNIGLAFTEVAEDFPEGSYAALELSSFQLESIDGFCPKISAILNFTPDHLNRHHTYENYVAAKCRVFEYQTAEDYVVLNYDDPLVRKVGEDLLQKENHPKVVFFSRTVPVEGGVYILGRNIVVDRAFPGVKNSTASEQNENAQVNSVNDDAEATFVADVDQMQIFGPHNEENAMAAAAILLLAGAPVEVVRQGLYDFKGVAHRIEYVGTVDGVNYYNDSKATNPDAAIKGILAMKSEKTILIGGGYDKGTPYDEWVKLFDGRVRKLILIGQTAQDILACCKKYGYPEENILMAETFPEAIAKARANALPGDSVLLSPACASWGMFKNYEERGDQFREMVQEMQK